MTIWSDTQEIDWSEEERAGLAEMGRDDVLGEMPVFCHFRPEGGAGVALRAGPLGIPRATSSSHRGPCPRTRSTPRW